MEDLTDFEAWLLAKLEIEENLQEEQDNVKEREA